MLDKNGGVWIADRDLGLIYTADYENYTQIRPPGRGPQNVRSGFGG
jgi:hypothetical protein